MSLLDEGVSPSPDPSASYPPPQMILLILLLAVLVGGMVGSGLAYALGLIWGMDPQEAMSGLTRDSAPSLRNYVRAANLVSHFFAFTVPAVAVAWFIFRRRAGAYFRLTAAPRQVNVLGGIAFVIFAFPVAQLFYWINRQLPLPDWVWEMENATGEMIQGLLVMESPAELLLNLLVVAVVPAVGEELIFRGMVQQQLQRFWKSGLPAIWITAILFSAIHLQFAGFLPRVILGAVLGYLFYWSGNLWVPIIGHFVTNGLQVAAQYVAGEELSQMNLENADQVNWAASLFSLALLLGTGYYLKTRNQDQD